MGASTLRPVEANASARKMPNRAVKRRNGTSGTMSRPESPGSVLYYFVDDIIATFALLREKGVQFMAEPHMIAKMPDHDLWLAEFKDSEGNFMALMSEIRHAA